MMFLIASPLAHIITTGGNKRKTEIRSYSESKPQGTLSSLYMAGDSDISCHPELLFIYFIYNHGYNANNGAGIPRWLENSKKQLSLNFYSNNS